MKQIEEKLKLLLYVEQVFQAYLDHNFKPVCITGCSACCTQDVTLTSLEAYRLVESLRKADRMDLLAGLSGFATRNLFRPGFTTNDLARACLNQEEPPEEAPVSDPAACPLLENGRCPVYEVRPFGCRSFLSLERCDPGGEALAPPEYMSVVTACMQIIEHLDVGGYEGNLTDLLLLLAPVDNADRYASGLELRAGSLPKTKLLPGFLIPPEHDVAVRPFMVRLFGGDVEGKTFHERMRNLGPQE